MSTLDAIIETLSPAWAARRAAARANVERSKYAETKMRGFNAVSTGRRAGDDWRAFGDTDGQVASADLATLRTRARDMAKNNPYWRNAKRAIVSEVIGHGIRATVTATSQALRDKVQRSWDDWAGSRHVDVTGRLDWYGVQALVMATVVSDGEALVLRRMVGSQLKLQVLGGKFLCADRDAELANGGEIVGGVETDAYGSAVAYHIYRRDPSRSTRDVVRIDAADVAHVFLVEEPNQLRGVSWIAPVYTRLKDWDDYEDAELMRQKVAACFGAVYTGVGPEANDGAAYETHDKIEPGMIEYMPPGTKVELISPPAAPGLREAGLINHRAVAAGLGITYEALTGDYSNVNYSSARMGRLQMFSNVRAWQQHVMIDLLCDRVWPWFVQAYTLRVVGQDDGAIASRLAVTWTPPSRTLVDPEKETKADMKRVRAGFTPWFEVVREQGRDPDQVAQQIAADNERFDKLGLVLDIDPRKLSEFGQGATNTTQEKSDEDEQDSEDADAA